MDLKLNQIKTYNLFDQYTNSQSIALTHQLLSVTFNLGLMQCYFLHILPQKHPI